MESIDNDNDNDNGAPVLSNGGLPLPAEHMPMPAKDSAIALEKDVELGSKMEGEMDKKIIAKPNEAAREDFLRQSGDELLMDGWYSGYISKDSTTGTSTNRGANRIFEFCITGPIETDKKLYAIFDLNNPISSVDQIAEYQFESIFQSLKLPERKLLYTSYGNIPLNFFVSGE